MDYFVRNYYYYYYYFIGNCPVSVVMRFMRDYLNCLFNSEPKYFVGLGGLAGTCSPRDPRFAGSIPAEVDGFFQDVKILSTSPPGGNLSCGSIV